MRRLDIRILLLCSLLLAGFITLPNLSVYAMKGHSQATNPAPPVNQGVTATVNTGDQDEINVRSGPGTYYALVGKLLAGQSVPAIGRSAGGDWVQIVLPSAPGGVGWVYSWLVTLSGELPVAEPPPPPTPRTTPTIDPTLAAQFIITMPPTRLPTFTPPPPLAIQTFQTAAAPRPASSPQVVYLIFGLGLVGVLGVLASFIRIR